MTVPSFSNAELIEFLTQNGCEVVSNDFFNDQNRIILKKGEHTFVIQFLNTYHFPYIVRLCMSLDIEAPAEHQKCYDQCHEQLATVRNQNPPK